MESLSTNDPFILWPPVLPYFIHRVAQIPHMSNVRLAARFHPRSRKSKPSDRR